MDDAPFVIFDLDGTLADSQAGIVASFERTLADLGLVFPAERVRELIGPPLSESFAHLGFPADEVADAVALYRRHYDEVGVDLAAPYPGVVDLIDALVDAGVALAVATAKRVDFAERMLANFGLRNRFRAVCGAALDGTLNLKIEVVDHALSQLGPPRGAGWMVGDRRYDIRAGHARGLTPVGVLWGYGTREELEESGAAVLVDDPALILHEVTA